MFKFMQYTSINLCFNGPTLCNIHFSTCASKLSSQEMRKKKNLFTSLACHFFTFSFKVPAKIRESQNYHFLMSQRVLLVKCLFYFPSVLFLFDYRTWIASKMSIYFFFFFLLEVLNRWLNILLAWARMFSWGLGWEIPIWKLNKISCI